MRNGRLEARRRRIILGWKRQGWEARYEARIVNYADDFVILCRHGAEEAMELLKLRGNEEKTRVIRMVRTR